MRLSKKIKKSIIKLLMLALLLSCVNISAFAGQFIPYNYGTAYIDDNNQPVIDQWRWIDQDNDGIAECYRFGKDGKLVSSMSMPDGKFANYFGQWEVDHIVQRVYFATMTPLISNSYQYNYKTTKTASASRVNNTGKDLEKLAEEKNKKKNKYYTAPQIKETETLKEGEYLGKKIKRPEAEKVSGTTINTMKEDDAQYDDGKTKKVYGIPMSKYVSASKNFTKEVPTAKIYGGDVWENCMCLAGHESYVKFTLSGNNYMQIEVAHQAHGTSTAQTYCYLEILINGESVDIYEDFVDSDPFIIEEWFDEGDKTVELRWMVPTGSQGRKLYLRNGVFRKLKDD